MNGIIEFLTSKEVIVVYIVAAIACFLAFIVYLVDKNYTKHKRRQNTKMLNKLVEEVNEALEKDNAQKEEKTEVSKKPEVAVIEKKDTSKENASVNKEQAEAVLVAPISNEQEKSEVIEKQPVVEAKKEKITNEKTEVVKPQEVSSEITPIETIAVEEKKAPISEAKASGTVIVTKNVETLQEQEEVKEAVKEEVQDNIVLENLNKIETDDKTSKVEEAIKEETLEYTSVEPNPEQAKKELEKIALELEKQKDGEEIIDLTSYEEEQESNAIISLEELVRKSKEMYAANELSQYKDEGNEPISLADLENRNITRKDSAVYNEPFVIENVVPAITDEEIKEMTEEQVSTEQPVIIQNKPIQLADFNTVSAPKVEQVKVEVTQKVEQVEEPAPKVEAVREVKPAYQATTKFKSSPVISPIYGIEKTEADPNDIELENTANYDKLDEEIRKTNEFLMTLKELQKHLD